MFSSRSIKIRLITKINYNKPFDCFLFPTQGAKKVFKQRVITCEDTFSHTVFCVYLYMTKCETSEQSDDQASKTFKPNSSLREKPLTRALKTYAISTVI